MITKISSLKFINLSDTRKIGKILQNRVPGNMRKYLTKTLPRSRETIPPSLNVLAHKLSVKFASQGVIDESLLLLVGFGPRAIFEHNIIVPSSLHLHVRLVSSRRVRVLLAEQRIAGQNVLHPDG